MYREFFKRAIDVTVAIFGLTITSPIFILVTLILYSSNNGKPFFTQSRPGRHERIFSILKFKTMTDETDAMGNLLPEAQRTTAIGNFLRKSSIDEIPQLINVLKGDMSLIGPRPLRTHYLPYYTETERIRHSVRPGITGLAQVSGRNALSWDDRLKLDVQYVENLSFMQDMNILLKTVKKLISPEQVVFDPNMLDLDELRRGDTMRPKLSTHLNGYELIADTQKPDILDERPLQS
ncbi:MAG TPA: sugar transferase [Sphingobacteriaceae bacterium]